MLTCVSVRVCYVCVCVRVSVCVYVCVCNMYNMCVYICIFVTLIVSCTIELSLNL